MKKFGKPGAGGKPFKGRRGDKPFTGDRSAKPMFGGDRGEKRSFGRKPSTFVKDGVRPMMHQATCSECHSPCQVPFKPNGKKPILCSKCFQPEGNEMSRKFVGKSNRGEREMFEAVCDDCGNDCEVPFRPIEGKPIRCRNCFGHEETGARSGSSMTSEQFATLNTKLDAILKMLKELEV